MATRTGERKLQILRTLAEMLQDPKGEKITTAALAAKLDVSEAALYRHFASKAQMYEGLIEFIEESLFGLVNKITGEEENGAKQLHAILAMLLGFAEKNPGMTRVLIGDALVNEDPRLQARINQLHDGSRPRSSSACGSRPPRRRRGPKSGRTPPGRTRTCCSATSSAAGTSSRRAASSASPRRASTSSGPCWARLRQSLGAANGLAL